MCDNPQTSARSFPQRSLSWTDWFQKAAAAAAPTTAGKRRVGDRRRYCVTVVFVGRERPGNFAPDRLRATRCRYWYADVTDVSLRANDVCIHSTAPSFARPFPERTTNVLRLSHVIPRFPSRTVRSLPTGSFYLALVVRVQCYAGFCTGIGGGFSTFSEGMGERFRKIIGSLKAAKLSTLFLYYRPTWGLAERIHRPVDPPLSFTVNTGMGRGQHTFGVCDGTITRGRRVVLGFFGSKAFRTLPVRPNHARVCAIHI